MLAGAHKKFESAKPTETYLADLRVQYKPKVKLPLDLVNKNVLLYFQLPDYKYPCFIPTFSIPCNAELTARLIVSVDRDARFCALELDVLLAILLVDANSR